MEISIEDKYTMCATTQKANQKNKQDKHTKFVDKKTTSNQFLASWLEEKKTILRQEKKAEIERTRQALEITRCWKHQRRLQQIQEAKEAWENMPADERQWLLELYEDMHYDHSNNMSYARRHTDKYGVWEYYLDHANELWKKYKT